MKTRCINHLIALVLALWGTASLAATTTTTFGVSATIVDSCSVSATALGFGNVDPVSLAGTAVDATTTVDVTCANGTAYDVGLDAGTASGATVTTRQMTSGANTLNYALYSDSGRTTNWGNTVATDTVTGTGDGTAQSLTVYGRIPSGQGTVPTGAYSDTITVTVTY
jgi:spore coat protein U-like protein